MSRKRRIALIVVTILLLGGIAAWYFLRGDGYMDADVRSSNGSHYAMKLPASMEPANLNDNASLEYVDSARSLYVMVIDESKAKIISYDLDYDLDTYMKIASRTLDSAGMYVNKPGTINGYKVLQTEIRTTGKKGTNVYKLTCVETPKYFYQVLAWTSSDQYDRNKADMEKIVNSFREVETIK